MLSESAAEHGASDIDHRAAAFLAGVIFAFAPSRFLFAGFGQFNVLSTAWMPFYVWSLRRMVRQPGPRWAVATGVFLLLNALAEYTYASFVLIFTAFYLLYLWFADRAVLFAPRPDRGRLARRQPVSPQACPRAPSPAACWPGSRAGTAAWRRPSWWSAPSSSSASRRSSTRCCARSASRATT